MPHPPAPAQPAYRWADYNGWCEDKGLLHDYIHRDVFAAARELAPAPVPAKPEPVVGEGYKRVPDGTVITGDMEFWGSDKTWEKTGNIGGRVGVGSSGRFVYRRPVKPKPEPVKVDCCDCDLCVAKTVCMSSVFPREVECLAVQRHLATAIEAAKGESK